MRSEKFDESPYWNAEMTEHVVWACVGNAKSVLVNRLFQTHVVVSTSSTDKSDHVVHLWPLISYN